MLDVGAFVLSGAALIPAVLLWHARMARLQRANTRWSRVVRGRVPADVTAGVYRASRDVPVPFGGAPRAVVLASLAATVGAVAFVPLALMTAVDAMPFAFALIAPMVVLYRLDAAGAALLAGDPAAAEHATRLCVPVACAFGATALAAHAGIAMWPRYAFWPEMPFGGAAPFDIEWLAPAVLCASAPVLAALYLSRVAARFRETLARERIV
jgi:hypothetical protein